MNSWVMSISFHTQNTSTIKVSSQKRELCSMCLFFNELSDVGQAILPHIEPRAVGIPPFGSHGVDLAPSSVDNFLMTRNTAALLKFTHNRIDGPLGGHTEVVSQPRNALNDLVAVSRSIADSAEDEELAQTGIEDPAPVGLVRV